MTETTTAKPGISRILVVTSLMLLIVHHILYNLLLLPASPLVIPALLQTLPLLLFVPGVLAVNIRVHQWLCFLILIYFISGVLNIFTPDTQLKGILEVFYCVLLFSSAIVFINRRHKADATKA